MRKKLVIGAFIGMLILSITGCGQSDSNKSEIKIASQINVEAGQEVKFDISNYDELNETSVEVKDDDIAKIKENDGTITVEGIKEGETVIKISANGVDDVAVNVKVDKNNNIAPLYEKYEFELPPELLGFYALSFEGEEAGIFFKIAGACDIPVKFELQLDLSEGDHGSGKFIIKNHSIVDELQTALLDDETFLKAISVAYDIEIDDYNKYDILAKRSELNLSNDIDDYETDIIWSFKSETNQLFWGGEAYTLNPDGSFCVKLGSYGEVYVKVVPVE